MRGLRGGGGGRRVIVEPPCTIDYTEVLRTEEIKETAGEIEHAIVTARALSCTSVPCCTPSVTWHVPRL